MLKRGCLLLFNPKYEEKSEENKEPKETMTSPQ